MTLNELKTLKVGQIVKYTNDVDKLNVEYWEVNYTSENGLILQDYKRKHIRNVIGFDDPDINHIASMLTIDRPLWDKMGDKDRQLKRELRLVEAKIRDAEFKIAQIGNFRNALLQSNKTSLNESNKISAEWDNLEFLIEQRNELIEKI